MDRSMTCGALLGAMGLVVLGGCGTDDGGDGQEGPKAVSLQFAAKVGDKPFSCTETFEGVGTSKSTVKPLDFRMYVYDVRLIRADGAEETLALEQDGTWQRDNVAFLDFEDGSGTCETGSPETRSRIVGTVPAGEYVGARFNLGLPNEMNHLDAPTAPAPFNIPGMWWSWKGGYKFVRLELSSASNPTYFFHLGATTCDGSVKDGFSCDFPNLADIRLDGVDPDASTIVFDIASLYAGSDLDRAKDPMDGVSGCMAFAGDPECPPVFKALGMTFGSDAPSDTPQTTFRVE